MRAIPAFFASLLGVLASLCACGGGVERSGAENCGTGGACGDGGAPSGVPIASGAIALLSDDDGLYLVVADEPPRCETRGQPNFDCGHWQLDLSVGAEAMGPGSHEIDDWGYGPVSGLYIAIDHEDKQGHCPSGSGNFDGTFELVSTTASEVVFRLSDIHVGVLENHDSEANRTFVAPRCPPSP